MQDQEQQLKRLEEKVTSLTNEKVRKTEQLRLLREQRDAIVVELQQLGLTPAMLQEKIASLKQEIDQEIADLENQIPQ